MSVKDKKGEVKNMTKEAWTELARKVKATKITAFELGVLAGLSSKYDFREIAAKQENAARDEDEKKPA